MVGGWLRAGAVRLIIPNFPRVIDSVDSARSPGTIVGELACRASPGGPVSARLSGILTVLREFAFGMTGYEFTRHAAELGASLETLFMVNTVGDMIGLPVIPPYYAL